VFSGSLQVKEKFCDLSLATEGIGYFFISDPALLQEIKSPVCRTRQVHGKDLLQVSSEHIGPLSGSEYVQYSFDGLMTDLPGPVMAVYTADCLPILMVEPEKRVVAAIHAGWKGTLLNISGSSIDEMVKRFRCSPSEIRVISGPAIRQCCFEIKEDVADQFRRTESEWGDHIVCSEKKMKLNLHEINRKQLLKKGVSDHHIEWNESCTFCHADNLPSFRREKTGSRRMISGIGLKNGGRN
jgi:YfiH family protein